MNQDEPDIVIALRKLGYTVENPRDRVEWTKGYKAGIEDERNRRKVRQTPYGFSFWAGVAVGMVAFAAFFLAIVLLDKI